MGPEELGLLTNAGIATRKIQQDQNEAVIRSILADRQMSAKAKQDAIENYMKGVKLNVDIAGEQRLQRGQEFDQSKITHTSPYEANGRIVMNTFDAKGNITGTRDLGEARGFRDEQKMMKTPEGKIIWVKPGQEPPPGSTYVPQGTSEHPLSINDKYTLMSLKAMVETGKDLAKNEYDNESDRDNAMAIVNASDPSIQYVKIPGQEVDWGKDVPSKYVKIPKQATQIAKLPSGTVVYHDAPSGKVLTIDAVKQLAKDKGYSVEEFIKISGIGK